MSQFNQVPLISNAIPDLLKSLKSWVVWEYGPINLQGKRPKIPLSPHTFFKANALDLANQLSFADALSIYKRKKSDGIGLALNGSPIIENSEGEFYLVALDLDGFLLNSVETQEIWTAAGKPYREISPSGKGVRMFALSRNLYRGGNARNGRELYASGRFVTVTGNSGFGEITDKTEQLNKIHDQWFMKLHSKLNFKRKTSYSEPETPRQIARLKAMLSFISADCDYETYRNVIWAILDSGWDSAECICLEWSRSSPARFDQKTLSTLVKSLSEDRPVKPTMASSVYVGRNECWND